MKKKTWLALSVVLAIVILVGVVTFIMFKEQILIAYAKAYHPEIVAQAEMHAAFMEANTLVVGSNTFAHKYGGLPGDFDAESARKFGFSVGGNEDGIISEKEAEQAISHLKSARLINPDKEFYRRVVSLDGKKNHAIVGKQKDDGTVSGVITPAFAKMRNITVMNSVGKTDCLKDGELNMTVKERTCLVVKELQPYKRPNWRD